MPSIIGAEATSNAVFTASELVHLRMLFGIPEVATDSFYTEFNARVAAINALPQAPELRQHIRYLMSRYDAAGDDHSELIDQNGTYWSGKINRRRLLTIIYKWFYAVTELTPLENVWQEMAENQKAALGAGTLNSVPISYGEQWTADIDDYGGGL